MLVGQERVLDKINNFTLGTFPSSTILLGEDGCGKHTLLSYIAAKFHITLFDISSKITQDTISDVYNTVEPTLYFLEASKLTVRQQNMLLKLIEEPPKGVFIVILCDNKSRILQTVWNRCQVIEFEPYKKEILKTFVKCDNINVELLLDVATTPGQVLSFQSCDLSSIVELANKIFEKINVASLSNTLSISNKIAFKNEKDKIDINLFIKVLNNCISNKIRSVDNLYYYKMFKIVQEFIYKSKQINVDMRYLFDNLLCNLWECSRV